MTATAKPATATLIRTPAVDAVFGRPTFVVTLGKDVYRVRCERLDTGDRVTFVKNGGGESVVRADERSARCTCKGWGFSKGEPCRHMKLWADEIKPALLAEEAEQDHPEVSHDWRESVAEMDTHYAAFDWE